MKTVSWHLSIGYPTANREGEFEVEDDTPDDEIEEMVREEAHNFIEWSWTAELPEEDDSSSGDDVSAAGESFVKDQAHRERIEKGE